MEDNMHYRLLVEFELKIAKWRIDDPLKPENAEYSLMVYDRNLEQWVNINNLNRPGEFGHLSKITMIVDDESPAKAGEPPGESS